MKDLGPNVGSVCRSWCRACTTATPFPSWAWWASAPSSWPSSCASTWASRTRRPAAKSRPKSAQRPKSNPVFLNRSCPPPSIKKLNTRGLLSHLVFLNGDHWIPFEERWSYRIKTICPSHRVCIPCVFLFKWLYIRSASIVLLAA